MALKTGWNLSRRDRINAIKLCMHANSISDEANYYFTDDVCDLSYLF